MTSAASFVHGSGDEQDIEEFLSQIDDMTSAAAADGSSGEVNLRGGNTAGGADLFLGSLSPPTQQRKMGGDAGELVLRPDEGRAIADAFPADWLSDLEGLGLEKSRSPATPTPEEQQAPAPANAVQQRQQQQDQQHHRAATEHITENEEVLGTEPEILDEETAYDSGAAAAGMLMSAGGRMASWASSTPAAFVGAAAAALRGDTLQATGISAADGGGGGSAEPPSATTTATPAADEPPLDWPVTLDMLGMADAEAQPDRTPPTTVVAPVSELPSMAPPADRENCFPDFVEIRDPLHVSQFPKPGKTLAVVGSNGGGDGHTVAAGEDCSRVVAVGQGRGQGQRQVLREPLRTVEVYLRPDVTWESVSDAYMAVMLSRGLVVRQQTEKTVRLPGRGGAFSVFTQCIPTCIQQCVGVFHMFVREAPRDDPPGPMSTRMI